MKFTETVKASLRTAEGQTCRNVRFVEGFGADAEVHFEFTNGTVIVMKFGDNCVISAVNPENPS